MMLNIVDSLLLQCVLTLRLCDSDWSHMQDGV